MKWAIRIVDAQGVETYAQQGNETHVASFHSKAAAADVMQDLRSALRPGERISIVPVPESKGAGVR